MTKSAAQDLVQSSEPRLEEMYADVYVSEAEIVAAAKGDIYVHVVTEATAMFDKVSDYWGPEIEIQWSDHVFFDMENRRFRVKSMGVRRQAGAVHR